MIGARARLARVAKPIGRGGQENPQEHMAIYETSAVSSAAVNGKHGHSLISDQKFHQLYALALDFHSLVERGVESLSGQEAALAGVAACMLPEDVLVSEDADCLIDPAMEMFGARHTGLHALAATSDGIVDALSAAVSNRMRRNRRVTVLFSPDNAGAPLLDEARAVAAGAKLPVIFVEHGNGATTPSPRTGVRKTGTDDLISIPVDAHDVIAIYRVAHESITRARSGSGPTRIVCFSPQTAGDRGSQASKDAVAALEQWLMARGLPVERWRQEIVAKRAVHKRPEEQDGRGTIPQNAA